LDHGFNSLIFNEFFLLARIFSAKRKNYRQLIISPNNLLVA